MSAFHLRAAAVRLSALSAGLCIALSAAAQPDAAPDPTTLDAINVKAERARTRPNRPRRRRACRWPSC
ncbi:hypothetical protein KHF85_18815 [Xanthomonas translucens pv. graminis]|uniref:hypothetical protein n=1 Tax=Xanthomonas graminis TaxID=3390026 RepID=UPI0025413AB3|nr:hypothetical protein [Xanthomonas translucens]WIH04784.1 hypothetical protein KHF85_18815 [Xanthomonas translucens pv. graminis]